MIIFVAAIIVVAAIIGFLLWKKFSKRKRSDVPVVSGGKEVILRLERGDEKAEVNIHTPPYLPHERQMLIANSDKIYDRFAKYAVTQGDLANNKINITSKLYAKDNFYGTLHFEKTGARTIAKEEYNFVINTRLLMAENRRYIFEITNAVILDPKRERTVIRFGGIHVD